MRLMLKDDGGGKVELPLIDEHEWLTVLKLCIVDDDGKEIPIPTAEEFGAWLLAKRTERGKSMEDVADACGVSRQAIWNWESGRSRPNIDNLVKVAKLLYVDDKTKALEKQLDDIDTVLKAQEA